MNVQSFIEKEQLTIEQVSKLDQAYKEIFRLSTKYETELIAEEYIDELFHRVHDIVNRDIPFVLDHNEVSTRLKTLFYNYYSFQYKHYESITQLPISWLHTYYTSPFYDDIEKYINGNARLYSSKWTVYQFYKIKEEDNKAHVLTKLTRKGIEFSVVYIEGLAGRSLSVSELEAMIICLFDAHICILEEDKVLIPEGLEVVQVGIIPDMCINAGINRYKTHQRKLIQSEKMNKNIQKSIKELTLEQCKIILMIAENGFREEWFIQEVKVQYRLLNYLS